MNAAREALDQQLAQLDSELAAKLPALDQAITTTAGGIATAGGGLQGAEDAANENVAAASDEYDQHLADLQTKADAAKTAFDSVAPAADAGELIALITPVTIPTGGTPDCAAADIEGAINPVIAAIVTAISSINEALGDGSREALKNGGQKAAEALQSIRAFSAPGFDAEAEVESTTTMVNGLL